MDRGLVAEPTPPLLDRRQARGENQRGLTNQLHGSQADDRLARPAGEHDDAAAAALGARDEEGLGRLPLVVTNGERRTGCRAVAKRDGERFSAEVSGQILGRVAGDGQACLSAPRRPGSARKPVVSCASRNGSRRRQEIVGIAGVRACITTHMSGNALAVDHGPLTPAQAELLATIRDRAGRGEPAPSYRDLCAEFGWASTGTARDHLQALARKGYIRLGGGRARQVRLVDAPAAVTRVRMLGRVVAGRPLNYVISIYCNRIT